jgi:hypothetical protein
MMARAANRAKAGLNFSLTSLSGTAPCAALLVANTKEVSHSDHILHVTLYEAEVRVCISRRKTMKIN